jgi:hypothetical protein
MAKLRALPLLMPSDELRGIAPPAFERAAARARPGDDNHQGLVRTCAALALDAVAACTPPSARTPSVEALGVSERWSAGAIDPAAVRRARNDLFTALISIERTTSDTVRSSLARTRAHAQSTPIDAHADEVVCRYAALAAHFATSTVILVLDGIAEPRELTGVPRQAAGALAYRGIGLGIARSVELRQNACDQAEWELERPGAPAGHPRGALAVQIFHEYLGASWKDLSDAQRAYYFDFVEWALPSALRAS